MSAETGEPSRRQTARAYAQSPTGKACLHALTHRWTYKAHTAVTVQLSDLKVQDVTEDIPAVGKATDQTEPPAIREGMAEGQGVAQQLGLVLGSRHPADSAWVHVPAPC